MNIKKDVALADYSTMHLGGKASYLTEIDSPSSLKEALDWARDQNLPVLAIGGGSNIIWKDEGFKGLVLVNRIKKFEVSDIGDDQSLVSIGAGENWDQVVGRCVDQGLSGIECLSLIPGTAGATPIQNVGAYGQEISSVIKTVEAFDSKNQEFVNLEPSDCGFSYRNSRFKDEPGRFYITGINLVLKKTSLEPPFYTSLEHYLKDNSITDYSPVSIRQAVINIRNSKLPNPEVVSNCGSFFANPIISTEHLEKLESELGTDVPHWQTKSGDQKIAAGWLLENAGYKDYHDPVTGIGTWPQQSLVLVNESATSTAQLLEFKERLVEAVRLKYDITLVQEPQLLPA